VLSQVTPPHRGQEAHDWVLTLISMRHTRAILRCHLGKSTRHRQTWRLGNGGSHVLVPPALSLKTSCWFRGPPGWTESCRSLFSENSLAGQGSQSSRLPHRGREVSLELGSSWRLAAPSGFRPGLDINASLKTKPLGLCVLSPDY
jgi:hypothetical protein